MKIIDKAVYTFSKDNQPFCRAQPGEVLLFRTLDCFGGQITNEEQLMADMDLTKVNPAAGPVYIEGAEPGDVLAVDILDVKVADVGVACSVGETGPLYDISEVRTRVMPIVDGCVQFNDLNWPVTETADCWYVNSRGKDYDDSLIIGCKEMCRLMEPVYKWDPTDIFIYLSLQGNIEINQACRPMHDEMVNVRVGIPKVTSKKPLVG